MTFSLKLWCVVAGGGNAIAHFVYVHLCVAGGTQNTIIMAFVWSLTRLSTGCRRTRSTWQWGNNLSIRNRGEMNISSLPSQRSCLCACLTLLFRIPLEIWIH